MRSIQHIVAAVDQFPQDESVLARAAEIASIHDAKLTIIHVIDDLSRLDLLPSSLDLEQAHKYQHQLAEQRVKAALVNQKIKLDKLEVCILSGSPSQRLSEFSDEMSVDLIVMRAHQGQSIVEKIIGSTTDRVIRDNHSPVLVVKRPVLQTYQNIVMSVDHFELTTGLVSYVTKLVPKAKMSLLHVVQIPLQFEAVMLRAGSGHIISSYRDGLVRQARAKLFELIREHNSSTYKIKTRVVVGDPSTILVQATWSPKVDLIVIGPSEKGKVRRTLLGSVTRKVLRNAACDVLVCRTVS